MVKKLFYPLILLIIFSALTIEGLTAVGGGRVSGYIYGFTIDNTLTPLSWASITALENGEVIEVAYSMNGFYEMYLPTGSFTLIVEHPGYKQRNATIIVSNGSDTSLDFVLEQSGEPIPEFNAYTLAVLSLAILTTLLILKKRKIKG
ncbi:carboxypeptidase regulatory-like domain-containing protein [Candidatus Bathyarchaeota archaeon]|nr:carboxypeptidase regulatory-like domain-containing protein [Candidatus Bathyarchaeota archaeon]